MVGYINSIKDRQYKLCTPEIFEQLTNSPMVAQLIEDYRKGNEKAKSLLPSFMFQGYDPNVLLGKTGSRLAKNLKPTGLFILDFDHVDDPYELYDIFLKKVGRKPVLAHITPSGKGLRIVDVLPSGKTIEEAQAEVAAKMETKMDGVVKDLSRQSFCPQACDILYINKALLFGNVNAMAKYPVRDNLCVAQGFNPGITDGTETPSPSGETYLNAPDNTTTIVKETSPKGEDATTATENPGLKPCATNSEPLRGTVFPTHYNGIPYKRIVEELIMIHGGEPQVGNRENTIFRLASDLAKITDRSAPWLESLIPTFGLPEEEWRATIAQVCKKPMETGISRKLQDAIKRCEEIKAEEESLAEESADSCGDAGNSDSPSHVGEGGVGSLPPPMPKDLPPLIAHLVSNVPDHLKPAVCMMSFPALAAHVANCKFLMSSGEDEELGLAACLLAKQSGGKSCVKKPIQYIMADIDNADNISLARLKAWSEKRKNKKANEKGEPKPRVPILWLDEDITSASFMERLGAAEDGDPDRPNQCCYTHCNELEKLYNFSSRNGKAEIRQTIKSAFDRDRVGSSRATAEAINEKTHLRWNWTACSTIENGKDFFSGKMITDGAVSRVDFCTIIQPTTKKKYKIIPYTKEWRDGLEPYIKNLSAYRCETDEDGEIIPAEIEEAIALDEELDALTDERNSEMVDDVYEDYGRRCRVMTVKRMITIYIAEGQKWAECYHAFARWLFDYSMWAKMAFFYTKASEAFKSEKVGFKGHWSPLKLMHKTFTLSEFTMVCQKNSDKIKRSPLEAIWKYKTRGLITQDGDTYTICDAFCKKHGIE